jgi:hypothetical protein
MIVLFLYMGRRFELEAYSHKAKSPPFPIASLTTPRINTYETDTKQTTLSPLFSALTQNRGQGPVVCTCKPQKEREARVCTWHLRKTAKPTLHRPGTKERNARASEGGRYKDDGPAMRGQHRQECLCHKEKEISYSVGVRGRKYWVPLTGSWRRRRSCCRSSLRATKSISEVSMTSRSEAS